MTPGTTGSEIERDSGKWLDELNLPAWFVPVLLAGVYMSFLGALVGGYAGYVYLHIFTPGLLVSILCLTLVLRFKQPDGDFKEFLNYLFLAGALFLAGHIYWIQVHLFAFMGSEANGVPAVSNLFFTVAILVVIAMLSKALYRSRKMINLDHVKRVVASSTVSLAILCLPVIYLMTRSQDQLANLMQVLIFLVLGSVVVFQCVLLLRLYQKKAIQPYWLMIIVAAIMGLTGTGVDIIQLSRGDTRVGGIPSAFSNLMFLSILLGELVLMEARPVMLSYDEVFTQLEASEAYHKAVIETATDAIITLDEQGRITTFNKAASTMFGYREREIHEQPMGILVPEHFHMAPTLGMEHCLAAIRSRAMGSTIELEGHRGDGLTFPSQITISPMPRPDGNPSYTLILRDISEQKQTEKELVWLASFPERDPTPIIEVANNGVFNYTNPEARREFPELTSRGMEHPLFADFDTFQALKDQKNLSDEFKLEQHIYLRRFQYLPGSDSVRVYIHDITRLKQTERQLSATNVELETFVYSASHDMKAPLVSMTGFLGVLKEIEEENLSDEGWRAVSRIEESLAQMNLLLQDLTTYASIDRTMKGREPVDLNRLLENMRGEIQPFIDEKKVFLLVPHMPRVQGDSLGLYQVFLNLVTNAVKYMGDQTVPRVGLEWEQQGNEYHFKVMDNGIGVDPAYHEKIFEPFQVLKDRKAGRTLSSGLGLSIVSRVIENHGGHIWLESDGKRGSIFHFTLPVNPEILSVESGPSTIRKGVIPEPGVTRPDRPMPGIPGPADVIELLMNPSGG